MPIKPGKGETQSEWMKRCTPEMMGREGGTKRPQEQAVAACLTMWRTAKGEPEPKGKAAQVADMKLWTARMKHIIAQAMADKRRESVESIIKRWKEKVGEDPSEAFLKIIKQGDVPYPEDDESREDFMDRCQEEMSGGDMDEDEIEDACEMQYEDFEEEKESEKSATGAIVQKTHDANVAGTMEFVLSDATPDRFGDIVEPRGWNFDNFKKNPVALFNHRSDWPIGTWRDLRVANDALRGNLVLAPKGTSPRIDEIRALVEAGILRAVSVGFKPLESHPRDNQQKGVIYTRSELVETSLVSIPANPNALQVAKSIHISPETISLVFGEHADKKTDGASKSARERAEHGSNRTRASKTGEHARTHRATGGSAMALLSKRIEEAEKHVIQLKDQLTEHLDNVDDENPDDAGMTVTEELTKKIADAERNRDNLKAAEQRLARSSVSDRDRQADDTMRQTTALTQDHRRPYGLPSKKVNSLDYLVRQGVIQAFAHTRKMNLMDTCKLIYGEDELTKAYLDYTIKAASSMATTTVTGWAAELVQQVYSDFMQLLVPASILPRLSNLGLSLTFGRAGRIVIPTRNATPSIAGSFVGEGAPIPVRQAGFGTQTLTPKKLAVITTWTREIDEHSIPAIEGLLREAIQQDTSVAIDVVLVDNNPATAIRPAGLRNGVSGLTATAGGGYNALVGDIKQLTGALLTATAGNVRNGVFLMNPQQVLSISLTQPPYAATGLFPFADEIAGGRLRTFRVIESANVPLGMVIALDAADFVSVGSEAPRFEVSDQATLHLEDTSPQDITGGTPSPAVPVKSMFQTDSLALRLVWPMNWVLRRTGMVSWTSSVTW